MEPLPAGLQGVGVVERVGESIPLNLQFVDSEGRPVTLAQYFTGERPVLLMLVYYRCPMLCGLLFNGVVEGLRELAWTPGRQFDIVTVSIDPLETPTLARAKKQNYLRMYERPEAAAGWHFLTGREADIRALADAVGFGYRWVDERQEYAHAAAVMVMTPGGTVSRYLYGLLYDGRSLRLALTGAGEGRVGSTADRILLYCFHYDADAGRFVVAAANVMRLGAVGTATVLGLWLGGWWLREWRRRRRTPQGELG